MQEKGYDRHWILRTVLTSVSPVMKGPLWSVLGQPGPEWAPTKSLPDVNDGRQCALSSRCHL